MGKAAVAALATLLMESPREAVAGEEAVAAALGIKVRRGAARKGAATSLGLDTPKTAAAEGATMGLQQHSFKTTGEH